MTHNNYFKVLDLIYNSIVSEGGDGDAIWLSKHATLKEIAILIEEFMKSNAIDWIVELHKNYLLWGQEQEWAVVTCDENVYNQEPSYTTLKINY